MKFIQIIDDAINCTYDIFSIDEEYFKLIFPENTDVEFESDLLSRLGEKNTKLVLEQLWKNRSDKKKITGIHGTLFFGEWNEEKKPFYPTKKESEMIANP